jgi:hypothetical protein
MLLPAAILVLASPLLAQSPSERAPDEQDLAVGGVLASAAAEPHAARLLQLGPAAIPALFEALVTEQAAHRAERDGPVTWIELDADRILGVRAALEGEPARPLLDHLRRVDSPEERRRVAALRLFGGAGEPRDLPTLVWLLDEGPRKRIARSRRDDLQRAFERILERHASAHDTYDAVRRAYDSAPDSLLAGIIWAVSSESSEERLWVLAGLLERRAEADPLILAELARMGKTLPHPVPEEVLSATRRYLGSADPEILLSGIEAAESLEDVEALPTLIELLEHRSRAVAEKALAALRSMTGLAYARDPRRWQEWHRKAEEWRTRTAPRLLRHVLDGVPGRASHALMELSKWRVFHHELADGVAAGIEREETELVVLACSVLGHLGSWKAVPALVERLDDEEPAVQRAALLALRSITRTDAGSDPSAWTRLAARVLQSPAAHVR